MPIFGLTRTGLTLCAPKPALPLEPPILTGDVRELWGQLASATHHNFQIPVSLGWQLTNVSRWTKQDLAARQWKKRWGRCVCHCPCARQPWWSLWGQRCYCHFTEEETKAQRSQVTCLKSHSYKMAGMGGIYNTFHVIWNSKCIKECSKKSASQPWLPAT